MPKVQMPQLGESVAEGTIGKWLKQPGDHVDKYEPIVEVITDKVNAEVPSPFEGTLTEILVQEGETVPNNTEIAVIEGVGESRGRASPTTQGRPAEAPAAVATAEALADETAAQAPEPSGPYGAGSGPGRFRRDPRADLRAADATSPHRSSTPAAVSATTAVAAPTMPGSNGHGNGSERRHVRRTDDAGRPSAGARARRRPVDGRRIRPRRPRDARGRSQVRRVGRRATPRRRPGQRAAAQTPMPMTSAPQAQSAPSAPSAPSPVAQGDSLKQASPMRKAIATQMTKALQVPVAYTVIEVDMSRRRGAARPQQGSVPGAGRHQPDLRRVRRQGDGRGAQALTPTSTPPTPTKATAPPGHQPGHRRGRRRTASSCR